MDLVHEILSKNPAKYTVYGVIATASKMLPNLDGEQQLTLGTILQLMFKLYQDYFSASSTFKAGEVEAGLDDPVLDYKGMVTELWMSWTNVVGKVMFAKPPVGTAKLTKAYDEAIGRFGTVKDALRDALDTRVA